QWCAQLRGDAPRVEDGYVAFAALDGPDERTVQATRRSHATRPLVALCTFFRLPSTQWRLRRVGEHSGALVTFAHDVSPRLGPLLPPRRPRGPCTGERACRGRETCWPAPG